MLSIQNEPQFEKHLSVLCCLPVSLTTPLQGERGPWERGAQHSWGPDSKGVPASITHFSQIIPPFGRDGPIDYI